VLSQAAIPVTPVGQSVNLMERPLLLAQPPGCVTIGLLTHVVRLPDAL